MIQKIIFASLSLLCSFQLYSMDSYALRTKTLVPRADVYANIYKPTSSQPHSGFHIKATYDNSRHRSYTNNNPAITQYESQLSLLTCFDKSSLHQHEIQNGIHQIKTFFNKWKLLDQKNHTALPMHVKNTLDLVHTVFKEPVLNALWAKTVPKIIPLLMDSYGNIKIPHTFKDIEKLNQIFEDFLNNAQKLLSYSDDSAMNADHSRNSQDIKIILSDVLSHKDFQCLEQIEQFCTSDKFESAYELVEKSPKTRCNQFYSALYQYYYDKNYTPEGIKKEYLNDPYYQKLGDLPSSKVPNVHNTTLQERDLLKKAIIKECNISRLSPLTEQAIYHIIDLQEGGPQGVIEYLCNEFDAQSKDPAKKQVYSDLISNGLPKIYNYNALISKIKIPAEMCPQDRALLAQLGLIECNDIQTENYISRTITYLQKAYVTDSDSYRILAHQTGNALLGKTDSNILNLNDFSTAIPSHQEKIKGEVVKFISINLKKTENTAQMQKVNSLMHKVNALYSRMIQGDLIAQTHLEEGLLPTAHEEILKIDVQKEFGISTTPAQENQVAHHLKEYAKAHRDIQANGLIYFEKEYSLDIVTSVYVYTKGEKISDYRGNFRGNQLDHAVHSAVIDNYTTCAHIPLLRAKEAVKEFVTIGFELSSLAHGYLKMRDYVKAMNFSHISYLALNYAQQLSESTYNFGAQAVTGTIQGVTTSVYTITDIMCHPIENLMIHLNRFGQEVEQQQIHFLNQMGTHLAPHEIHAEVIPSQNTRDNPRAVHDFFKETTQSIIATAIMGKSVRCLNRASTAVKSQDSFLRKHLNKSTQALEATTQQLEVKVAQATETCALMESEQAFKKGSKGSFLTDGLNIADYSPKMIDPELLIESYDRFKNTKGAIGRDGPLKRVLGNAKIECENIPGKCNMVRGSVYELEKALQIESHGEQIIEFGAKLSKINVETGRVDEILDIDLVTTKKLIECKSGDWEAAPEVFLNKVRSRSADLKKIAESEHKIFELHSKNPLPENLKKWFKDNQINFIEG